MRKKLLISTLILLLTISLANLCFAFDDTMNSLDNAGQAVGNVMSGIGNDVREGAENVGNMVQEGTQGVGNAITTGGNSVMNGIENMGNGNYTATRTATTVNAGYTNINPSMWIWITMAIAAISIVALVWYYASQHETKREDY